MSLCKHDLNPDECWTCLQAAEKAPQAVPEPEPALPHGRQARAVYGAACSLGGPFTLADLTVTVWMMEPALFGLDGYAHHPSDAKVRAVLYGRRGLIAQGWITKTSDGFAVGRKGV